MADKYDGMTLEQSQAENRRLAKREETQKDQLKTYKRYDVFQELDDEDVSVLGNMVGDDVPDADKAKQLYGVAKKLDPTTTSQEIIETDLQNIGEEVVTNVNPEANLQQADPTDTRPAPPNPNASFASVRTDDQGRISVPRGSVPDPQTPQGMKWYQDFAQAVAQKDQQVREQSMRDEIRKEVEADMRRDSMASELKPFGFNPENETDIPALNLGLALMHNGYTAEETATVLRTKYPDATQQTTTETPTSTVPTELPKVPAVASAGTLSGVTPGTPGSTANPTETKTHVGGGVYKQSDGTYKDQTGGSVPSLGDHAAHEAWVSEQMAADAQSANQVGN